MITMVERKEIVLDFARRHKGRYDPAKFLGEVEKVGENHPAHGWFVWDDNAAAREYRLWQARCFANDLKISFEVKQINRGKMTIRTESFPLAISPLDGRAGKGGYVIVDPESAQHKAELSWQASNALGAWLDRYGSLSAVTRKMDMLRELAEELEAVEAEKERPAAARSARASVGAAV